MKLTLPKTLSRLFGTKPTNSRAGISLHAKFVRLVKGQLIDGLWHYDGHHQLEVESEEQWPEAIIALFEQFQLSDSGCCLVLPGNRYQLLQIDKPAIPEEELAGALVWAVKDLVNLPAEDLVADYFQIPSRPNVQVEQINVVVTSARAMKPLIEVFNDHKVELQGIVPEELVLRNIIGDPDEASLLLTQQRGEEAALQIVKQQRMYFSRKLRGFNRIDDYSREELLDGLIDSLGLEVQRSMDFYQNQFKQQPVKHVLLALPSKHQQLIAEQISQHFNVNVAIMTLANQEAVMEEPLSEQFFPALGGALEYLHGNDNNRNGNGNGAANDR